MVRRDASVSLLERVRAAGVGKGLEGAMWTERGGKAESGV